MKRHHSIKNSFVFDDQHHLIIDKSLVFTDTERQRHELCVRLLDTIKNGVSTFKPSESLAHIPSLAALSHSRDNLYDYFVPTDHDHHFPSFPNDSKLTILQKSPSPPKPKVEIDIVISGGGLKGYFMTGCSHILKDALRKQNIEIRRIAGASAGAWSGLFMLCDFPTSLWIETYYLCRDRLNKTMHEAYEEMWPWAQQHLPEDAYKLCSGRLFISITEVTWCGLRNHVISEFSSNQDLFEACLASSAIPFLTFPSFLKKYRGMNVLDGGFTNNTPIFPDKPRRTLVFRITDLAYPVQLLVTPQDQCIEALVVRGAIMMSRFLQGEPNDTFCWIEYGGTETKTIPADKQIIRRSRIFQRLVNTVYHGILIGGAIYTIVDFMESNHHFWFEKHLKLWSHQLQHQWKTVSLQALSSAIFVFPWRKHQSSI